MRERLEKSLEAIGLSEKESRVYLASLALGSATAQTIAAKAAVNRPTTYVMIEGLSRKGLMSSFEKGKKRYFVSENPSRFRQVLEQELESVQGKVETLKKILPDLAKYQQAETPHVVLFEGELGLLSAQRELVEAAKKTGWTYSFAAVDVAREKIPAEDMRPLWDELYKKNKIKTKALLSTKEPAKIVRPEYATREARWISPEKFPFGGEMIICGDRVWLLDISKKTVGMILDNKEIAATIKVLFELAWENAKDVKPTKALARK